MTDKLQTLIDEDPYREVPIAKPLPHIPNVTKANALMAHWAAVDAILRAAGEDAANFGEIRDLRDERPIAAAFAISEGRR